MLFGSVAGAASLNCRNCTLMSSGHATRFFERCQAAIPDATARMIHTILPPSCDPKSLLDEACPVVRPYSVVVVTPSTEKIQSAGTANSTVRTRATC